LGDYQTYRARKPGFFGLNWDYTLARARTHARSQPGTRVSLLKPFYRAVKITAISAISINKVLAVTTMNDSRDGAAFAVFIDIFFVLNYRQEH
jgi:putative transposase